MEEPICVPTLSPDTLLQMDTADTQNSWEIMSLHLEARLLENMVFVRAPGMRPH